jgi:broad specificity phosphatase PhoE
MQKDNIWQVPEKVVYLIRHGQSQGNVSANFQGVDSPLNDRGREQAEQVAERVNRLSFDTLISSPQARAKSTAEAIARMTGKEIEFSELFMERRKPSGLNGKSIHDKEIEPLWRAWENALYTSGVRAEDGENFDDLVPRADQALNFLTARSENSLVVVTHGFFLRTIIARVVLGAALTGEAHQAFQSHFETENTGITVLRYGKTWEGDLTWKLWIYNDHAHLG